MLLRPYQEEETQDPGSLQKEGDPHIFTGKGNQVLQYPQVILFGNRFVALLNVA